MRDTGALALDQFLLAAVSVAMGACVLVPERAARLFGLRCHAGVIRLIGARDLAIGLGLFGVLPGSSRTWHQIHIVADAVDSAFVLYQLRQRSIARARAAAWLVLAAMGAAAASNALRGSAP